MPWHLLWHSVQRLAVALFVLLLALSGNAQAQSASATPTGYWLDMSGQAGLDEAVRATYQPYENMLGLGYGHAPVWIKLTLPAKDALDGNDDIVRVRPVYLDHVTLHDPLTGLRLESGDAVPLRTGETVSPVFSFEVPAMTQTRDVYLRIQTTSARLIEVDVTTPAEAHRRDLTQSIVIGFVIWTSLMFALGAVALWWHLRERVIGWYAVNQIMAAVFVALTTGFARVLIGSWLPAGWLDTLHSISVVSLSASATWFICVFLREYRPPRALLRVGHALTFLIVSMVLVGLWADWTWALRINMMLLLISACLPFVLLAFAAPDAQQPPPIPIRWLLLFYAVYLIMIVGSPLIFLGWMASSELVLYSSSIHIVLHDLVMSLILLLRAKAINRTRHEMQTQLAHEQRQHQIEKQHRAEQEKLFTMLAHELKTPLATLRMWLDAGYERRDAIDRTIADMNQIIERCVQTGQLSDHKLTPLFEDVDLADTTRTAIALCRAPEQVMSALPAMPVHVRADAHILAIVLANLLDNACKYSAAQTPIRVELRPLAHQGQNGWEWSLTNTPGPAGLPAPEQVFEKYYRSPQARRQSGSGLGLFLVKGLVELLQGTIRYAPEQEQVVFRLWLPAA